MVYMSKNSDFDLKFISLQLRHFVSVHDTSSVQQFQPVEQTIFLLAEPRVDVEFQ